MSYSGNFVDKSRIENPLGSCSIDGFGNTIITGNSTILGNVSVGAGDIIYGFNQDANLKISPMVGADQQGKKLTLNGGQGTGAGDGGDIELKTAESGVAGTNSNPLTTKMIIKQDGKVGISDTAPISELSVGGKIALTAEQGTPTAPTDGNGWLYTKAGGDVYFQSFDIAEASMTTKYRDVWLYQNNQGGTATNTMFLNGDPGYIYDYGAKNDGVITDMLLYIDNTDSNYTNWTNGTLQWKIYINRNATPSYTTSAYLPADFANAVSNNGREISNVVAMARLTGVNVSYNSNDMISVEVVSSGLNATVAGNMELVVNLSLTER